MPRDTLPEEAPGSYVPYGSRSYYRPDPLPPAKELDLDADFQASLQDAIFELGRLDGIGEESDTSPLVYTTMVRREAVESILIEGGDIDIEEVFRPAEIESNTVSEKDVKEALNYEAAIRKGADEVSASGTISLDLLKRLHATLLDGVRDECDNPGAFRTKPVHIPPPEPSMEPFIPPSANAIPELMENLEQYIGTGTAAHDLVALGITHYQFETIHPFGDGNGRLGRVLITLQLIQQGYLKKPYLYPSAYFNEHKTTYVKKMRSVSESGAWEPWLAFFMDGIRQQAADAVARTERLRTLRREYERDYGHEKTATDRLAMRLFQKPYLTTADAVELLDVSDQTARNAISELEASNVLEETTGKERYREYKAVDIFVILNESFD
jgi:Fic family protein